MRTLELAVASTSTTVQLRQRQHRLSCLRFHTPTGTHACSGRNRAGNGGKRRETAGGGGPSRCAVAPLRRCATNKALGDFFGAAGETFWT